MRNIVDLINESQAVKCELFCQTGQMGGPGEKADFTFDFPSDAKFIEISRDFQYINFYSDDDIDEIDDANGDDLLSSKLKKLQLWDTTDGVEDSVFLRIRK